MEFRILGPLEVVDGGRRVPLGGPRDRALLAILAIHAGQAVSAERLADWLWGEEIPGDPAHALQASVSRIRRALESPRSAANGGRRLLVTRRPGYLLDIGCLSVDATRFERLVESARRSEDPVARSGRLREALGLWRGPALADFAYESWAQHEIERLEELRLRAVEDRLEAELAMGLHEGLVAELTALAAEHPLREHFRGQLMLALYRSGRQGEALAIYEETRAVLSEELGIDPGADLQRIHRGVLRQDPSLEVAASAGGPAERVRTNLPLRLTSFVGRDRELEQVHELLAESRLVTLVGAGGAGKTRLAVEAGRSMLDAHPDGVWLVDLAPVEDASLLPHEVASVLGVGEQPGRSLTEVVVDSLREEDLVIILDNCEHLVESAARFAERVLGACAEVRVLATSREALSASGESLVEVPPLSVPGPELREPGILADYEAVRLFVDRASAARPDFVLDPDVAPAVADVCRRLEGIPLAIELAAALVPTMGVGRIASRLRDKLDILAHGRRTAPPRHRTFRAAVEWSHDLLGDEERTMLARLSVFVGGFTVEAAEAVCAGAGIDEADVLPLLSALVGRSLVMHDGSAGVDRYRLLEPLRQYAGERLEASGERPAMRAAHLEFFLHLAESAYPNLRGGDQRRWLELLEADHGNLLAALGTARELGDAAPLLGLAGALGPFWQIRARPTEGREVLRQALDRGEGPAALRARALAELAPLSFVQCDYADSVASSEQALAIYRAEGDRAGVAEATVRLGLGVWKLGEAERGRAMIDDGLRLFRRLGHARVTGSAMAYLGMMLVAEGELEGAEDAYRESLTWCREHGDGRGTVLALAALGTIAALGGDREHAAKLLEEGLALAEQLGDRWGRARCLASLARVALDAGEHERAAILFRRSMMEFQDLGDREETAVCLEGLAELALHEDRPALSAELLGAAEALRGSAAVAFSVATMTPDTYWGRVDEIRSSLGESAFAEAWGRGRAVGLQGADVPALASVGS